MGHFYWTHTYRTRESARVVCSLLAVGVPLLVAVDTAADAYGLTIGAVLTAWGRL